MLFCAAVRLDLVVARLQIKPKQGSKNYDELVLAFFFFLPIFLHTSGFF